MALWTDKIEDTGTTPHDHTNPTDYAIGDGLLAVGMLPVAGGSTWASPSGWTDHILNGVPGTATATFYICSIVVTQAVLDDAVISFTHTNAGIRSCGVLIHITELDTAGGDDSGIFNAAETTTDVGPGSGSVTAVCPDLTTTIGNSLEIRVLFGDTANVSTMTAAAVAGYTKQVELTPSTADNMCAVFTKDVNPNSGSLGTFTSEVTGGSGNVFVACVTIAVQGLPLAAGGGNVGLDLSQTWTW